MQLATVKKKAVRVTRDVLCETEKKLYVFIVEVGFMTAHQKHGFATRFWLHAFRGTRSQVCMEILDGHAGRKLADYGPDGGLRVVHGDKRR